MKLTAALKHSLRTNEFTIALGYKITVTTKLRVITNKIVGFV